MKKNSYFRFVCLLFAIVSTPLLIYSSLFPSDEMPLAFNIAGALFLMPVIYYIVVAAWQSWKISRIFYSRENGPDRADISRAHIEINRRNSDASCSV
jgi:hypothetical protein